MIILFLIADAIMTVVPFIMTGLYYPSMPDKMPLFLNLMGEPLVLADKTLLTAFRLPLMALILQAVCLVMYLGCRENTRHNPKTAELFRNFWLAASLAAAVKLSLSSIPYTGMVPHYIIPLFRSFTVAAALLGVMYLLMCLYRMLKQEGRGVGKIFIPSAKVYTSLVLLLLVVYSALVFLPGPHKG